MNADDWGSLLVPIIGIPATVFIVIRGIADFSAAARIRSGLDAYLSIYERAPEGDAKEVARRIVEHEIASLDAVLFPSGPMLRILQIRKFFRSLATVYFAIGLTLGAFSVPEVVDILRGQTQPPYEGIAATVIACMILGLVSLAISILPRPFVALIVLGVMLVENLYWWVRFRLVRRQSKKLSARKEKLQRQVEAMEAQLQEMDKDKVHETGRQESPGAEGESGEDQLPR